MNATDFITKTQYNELIQNILNGIETGYEKEIRINGNVYNLWIHKGNNFTFKEYGWIAGFLDENFKCDTLTGGRCVQGGTLVFYDSDITCYEDFIKAFNKRLKSKPDYTEEEQLSLF